MKIKDPLVNRFTQLRESGLSVENAWKVIAVETLADAGLLEAETLERAHVRSGPERAHVPILEAKLVKVIRIEPADDSRIQDLVARAKEDAALLGGDEPTQSAVMRRALRLGMGAMERGSQH